MGGLDSIWCSRSSRGLLRLLPAPLVAVSGLWANLPSRRALQGVLAAAAPHSRRRSGFSLPLGATTQQSAGGPSLSVGSDKLVYFRCAWVAVTPVTTGPTRLFLRTALRYGRSRRTTHYRTNDASYATRQSTQHNTTRSNQSPQSGRLADYTLTDFVRPRPQQYPLNLVCFATPSCGAQEVE